LETLLGVIRYRPPWSQVTRKLTSPFSTPPHSKFPVVQVNCAPYYDDIVIPASHGPEQGHYGPLKQSAAAQKHCGEAIGHWDSEYIDTEIGDRTPGTLFANRRAGQLA
jgi:hypothetical protein